MHTIFEGSTGASKRTSASGHLCEDSAHFIHGAAEISRTSSPPRIPQRGEGGADVDRASGTKRQNFIRNLAHVMVWMRLRLADPPDTRANPRQRRKNPIDR